MPTTPRKRPAVAGATRRGRFRQVGGVPTDAIVAVVPQSTGGGSAGITQLTGDVTAGPGSGAQAATIGANKVVTAKILDANVTLAKLVDLAALSLLGRAGNTSGVMAAITAANDAEVLRRSGTAIGFGTVATAAIADAAITLAKLANLAAQTLIGRNTAGSGVPEAVTLTQLLDWISGSVTQGDILVRGASSWGRLAGGSSGFFLGGNGAGAAPSYQGVTGFAHPLAQAAHVEYTVNIAAAFINQRGGSGTITATSQGHKAAGSILTTGQFYQVATAATNASSASMTSATSGSNQTKELSLAWDFDITYCILTDASAITSVRYMLGVGVNNEDTDTITAANWIGFRYSTSAGDGGWVGVCYNGTQVVTATVAAIAANTRYVLRVRRVGSTVFFSVNGGAEVSQATHVPSNSVYAGIVCRVTALSANVRSLWMGRIWCDYGT